MTFWIGCNIYFRIHQCGLMICRSINDMRDFEFR
jgi:hypothetical protein